MLGLSGLLLCFRIHRLKRVYARLDLRGDPGIDVAEVLAYVVPDVLAELGRDDVLGPVECSELRVPVEALLLFEDVDVGRKTHLTASKTMVVASVIYFSVFSLLILLEIHLMSLEPSRVMSGIITAVTMQLNTFSNISFMGCFLLSSLHEAR